LSRRYLIWFCAWAAISAPSLAARAQAVDDVAPTFANLQRRADAQATYLANAFEIVHIGNTLVVNEPNSHWRPVRDVVYRLSVDEEVFFATLGRPDLAQQWAHRRALGRSLEVAGYVAAAAGLTLTIWGLDRQSDAVALTGVGTLLGAFVVGQVGANMPMPSFPEDRAIAMANRYNQLLRAHLGLALSARF
jgi:hypothetical protein